MPGHSEKGWIAGYLALIHAFSSAPDRSGGAPAPRLMQIKNRAAAARGVAADQAAQRQ
jgi:hypothetical protein